MFFSVIIPTYNPRVFLNKLLESITHNNCLDEIEVIIADDISIEDFSDIINNYKDYYSLRVIENTNHFGAPMRGRQNGANNAQGKWIVFADQDDYFLDNAFDEIKAYIEKNEIHNYLIANFYEQLLDGNKIEQIKALNWTHGKFYEKEFWNNYNIQYNDTKYCEDIGLSVLIECKLIENNLQKFYYDGFVYVWVQNPQSLSKMNGYTNKGYFYKSFKDYINITLGTYVNRLEKYNNSEETLYYYMDNITSMIVYLYFYFQGMIFQNDNFEKDLDGYMELTRQYFIKFLKLVNWSINDFLQFVHNSIVMYNDTRKVCYSQIPFIETESFDTWIHKLAKNKSLIKNIFKKGEY